MKVVTVVWLLEQAIAKPKSLTRHSDMGDVHLNTPFALIAVDGDFASTLVADAPLFGVEVKSFSFSEDFQSKIPSIFEFGSSIIVLPSSVDSSGSSEHLLKVCRTLRPGLARDCARHVRSKKFSPVGECMTAQQALEEARSWGLLDPQFTWLGVHRMSRAHFDTGHDSAMDSASVSLLAQLTREMIFVKSLPLVSPRAFLLWDEVLSQGTSQLQSAFPTLNIEEKKERVFSDYFTEFAMAYDTLWLFASAFSRTVATYNSSDSWDRIVQSVEIHGALSDMWVDSSPLHTEMPHEVQIFTIGEANEHKARAARNCI